MRVSGWSICHAFDIDKLWIKIDPRVPFDRIERDLHLHKALVVLYPFKHTKTKERLHVEDTAFSIVKNDMKSVIFLRNNFCY